MKILFISHDANRAGAQLFLLNIMQYLSKKGVTMHLLLLSDGVLKNEFIKICSVTTYPKSEGSKPFFKKAISKLIQKKNKQKVQFQSSLLSENFDLVYANTIATAWVIPELLDFLKIPLITHIHELEFSIQLYSSKQDREYLFRNTTELIACSKAVSENITEKHHFPAKKTKVIHSFVENEKVISRSYNSDNEAIKLKHSLPQNTFLIGGCGNAEWRKGIDIFTLVASRILDLSPKNKFHFVWIGVKKEGEYYEQICYDIEKLGIKKFITFIEQTPDAIELINVLDVFTLPSREDPFPLVMLEAALMKRTIVGFEKTGGCSEFLEADAGIVVPYLNTDEMAIKIIDLYKNQILAQQLGNNAKEKVLKKYSFENSIIKIEELLSSVTHI